MKNIVICFILLLPLKSYCDDVIVTIGKKEIKESDIALTEAQINRIFEKKYKRLPNRDSDKTQIDKIKLISGKLILFSLLNNYLNEALMEKYYDDVVSRDMEESALEKIKKRIPGERKQDAIFLKAVEYVKNSSEKDKYRKAYDKFLKGKACGTYEFFKSGCGNDNYIKYLKRKVNSGEKKTLSPSEKESLFVNNLSEFIIKKESAKDKDVLLHARLAKKHRCNYILKLVTIWKLNEAKKMGCKIHSYKYGSLEEIMYPNLDAFALFLGFPNP